MPKVNLPEGCFGIDMADGTRYNADRNHQIEVRDDHATDIRRGYYGSSRLLVADDPQQFGTKRFRTCVNCRPTRRWNAWNSTCPRCGAATTEEQA